MSFGRGKGGKGLGRYQPTKEEMEEEAQMQLNEDIMKYTGLTLKEYQQVKGVKDKVHRIKSFQRRIGETDLPSSAKTRLGYHYIWLAHHALISENDSTEYERKMDAVEMIV